MTNNAGLAALAALVAMTISGCDAGTAGALALPPAPETHRISGAVGGAVAAGVTVALAGAASDSATTSATGAYAFDGLANGSYTVTPSRSGYTFSPVSRVVPVDGADVGSQDFMATAVTTTTHAISGTVSGATAQGVTLSLSGTATGTTATAANGTYAFTGIVNGSYTVTPAKPGYTFAPSSLAFTVSGADATGKDFVASAIPTYAISGTVSGATAQGVTVTLGGAASRTATTAIDGTYAFTGIGNGSYTVTPSRSGYTFAPSSRNVTVSGGNQAGNDFVASISTSTAPVLEAGFPICLTLANSHAATMTLTFTTAGPRHLVIGTAWYAFETNPFPLTASWVGGTPGGATAWTRQTWPNDGTIHWTSHIFTATASGALTSQQVTITRPNATDYTDALSCIYSFSGASGFAAATDHHSPMSDVSQNIFVPADVTVSATAADSRLVGVLAAGEIDINHLGDGGHVTARANTTVDRDNVAAGSGQAAFHLTAPTTGPGSYTIGITNQNRAYAVEAIEVLGQ